MEGQKSKEVQAVSVFLVILLVSCTQKPSWATEGEKLVQLSGSPIRKLGVLSDIHGDLNKLDALLAQLKKSKVDGILVAGDLVLNEELRYGRPDAFEDGEELAQVLDHLEEAGIPLWVIPGNHEEQGVYEEAFKKERRGLWDLAHFRLVDLKGINIVSLPGYYLREQGPYQFLPKDGFFLSEVEIQSLPERFSKFKDRDPFLVITHGPPKSSIENGVDVVPGVGHIGSEALRTALIENKVALAVFGHIHEGGPQGENGAEKIEEGNWSSQLWLNPGAVAEAHAVQLELDGNQVRWNQIRE